MSDMKFSVSMCVYGGDDAEHFKVAVDSILNQTCPPDEIVLVVDGPVPDDMSVVIAEYEKLDLFRVMRFEENQGHGNARRAGLNACRNELIAIMDADDISVPERFEKQLAVFDGCDDIDIVGGQIDEFIDTVDNVVSRREVALDDEGIKQYMKVRCPMNLVTVMFKKSSVEKAGNFIHWPGEEDYYLWIRMAIEGMHFANVEDVLVNVRVGDCMYGRRGGWKYFCSEEKLQKYMLDQKLIGYSTYFVNTSKRFIVQVLMPNKIRGWAFKKFARKSVK